MTETGTGGAEPFRLAACAEMLWPDRPLPWRVARLAEMGFGIGLWQIPDGIEELRRTGAWFTIMNAAADGDIATEDGATRLLASARTHAEAGLRLGVERLCITGSALGEGGRPLTAIEAPTGATWMRARDTLERLADLGADLGVTFALENLNPLDHPGVPLARTADVLALVASVDRPELRMNLDLYHTQLGEGDLLRWAEKCLPFIGEVQVADNPGRYEPGTGEVAWPAVARGLAAMGYAGPVTLEAWASGESEAALEAFRAAFTP
ncbi:TIM barrel protein [Wenxinia saemankumensis]|uniref:Hydroxypyruvate isomerase n=1 Tax=Wenxinia saemankumensis TaxID=1447782 RepID=A0A1M6AB29_9RHOB|nr:TIM barrel protein [Wenxinia saemankumensis]SHI33670.1 hydroxypyruvate isomerase [Wenxinia saemankumensis]